MKTFVLAALTFAITLNSAAIAQDNTKPGKATALTSKSARENKSTFVMVWRTNDEKTNAMKKVFNAATKKFADKANSIAINVNDKTEQDIVQKYRLNNAPLPLVLTVAANGAITGGFPQKVTEEMLKKSLVSTVEAQCMKNLQLGKVVFICIQDKNTKHNAEAMKGINDYIKDGNKDSTHVIMISPEDKQAKSFLKKLGMVEKPDTATTYLLRPPGVIGAKFEGATTKEKIKIVACTKGCC